MPVPQAISKDLLGRYIYAYRHIRTNQVLYSLTEQLKPRALAQLPDLGANNKPAEIRGDLWQSLWTLELPRRLGGYQQGFEIFQKLREWRVLREHNTQGSVHQPHFTDESLQQRLDERGGSKKEPVEKLRNRMERRLRVRRIMDQKANSVADLSHILREYFKGSLSSPWMKDSELTNRITGVLNTWSRRNTLDNVTKKITQLLEQVQLPQEEFAKVSNGKSKTRVQRMITDLKQEKDNVEDAVKLMSHVNVEAYHERWERNAKGKTIKEMAEINKAESLKLWWQKHRIDEARHEKHMQRYTWRQKLFDKFMARHRKVNIKYATSFTAWLAETNGVQRALQPRLQREFGVEGMTVLWRDITDKAHGRQWPGQVRHRTNQKLLEKHKRVLTVRSTKDLSPDELFWITERPVYEELATMSAAARQAALLDLAKDNDSGPLHEELLRLLGMQAHIQQAVLRRIGKTGLETLEGETGLETQEGKLQERRDWFKRVENEETVIAEEATRRSQQKRQAESDALSQLVVMARQPTTQGITI